MVQKKKVKILIIAKKLELINATITTTSNTDFDDSQNKNKIGWMKMSPLKENKEKCKILKIEIRHKNIFHI